MTESIQQQYRRYQQEGWPGMLSRPNEPHAFHSGILRVPANARTPRPGDAVLWDRGNNRFVLPTDDAGLQRCTGIIVYDPGTLQQQAAAAPDGANSPMFVEYKNGARIKIGIMGTFYVVGGEANEYDDLAIWDRADFKWDVRAAADSRRHDTRSNHLSPASPATQAVRLCPAPPPKTADGDHRSADRLREGLLMPDVFGREATQ